MALSRAARTLWAKTPGRESAGDTDGLWLALAQHLRDSADVGSRLADSWLAPSIQRRLTKAVGGEAAALVAWLAGTHDIGKAQLLFQAQIAGSPQHGWMWDQVLALPCTPDLPPDARVERAHATHSDLILRLWLRRQFPDADLLSIASVTSVAGCHHGRPSGLSDADEPGPARAQLEKWLDDHGEAWQQLWFELLEDIAERTGAREVLGRVLAADGFSVEDQLLLAGLVTMADWIASNQDLFPLTRSGLHSSADSRADQALRDLGLTRAWQPGDTSDIDIRDRFQWPADAQLRPSQTEIMRIARDLEEGPAMLIIEAETGEGKTEAALLAAEIMAERTGAGGVAFALPTMATSDAMYSRVQAWVESVSAQGGQLHSLFLGHSRSLLNRDYEDLARRTRSIDQGGAPGAEVIAHQWLRGRRRGLLSEFVVCTIDQILMCALATKYVTLRHLGLAGKVIIIDEVHAFDVYSTSYLQKALAWLGAHGAPVILLSATLASAQRTSLRSAYSEGLEQFHDLSAKEVELAGVDLIASLMNAAAPEATADASSADEPGCPRVTVVSAQGAQVESLPAREGHRRVRLQMIDDDGAALLQALEALHDDGGVVGIICNTVQRAQEVFGWVGREFGVENTELLHSQFTAADRADREQALVGALGPGARRGEGRPRLRVIVGTQVLEQSLDVDFDLLITDLAPTDALAQRAGRLHRHHRPDTDRPRLLSRPTVLIRGVDPTSVVPVSDTGSAAVYGERVLLATMAVLAPQWEGREWCLRHDVAVAVEQTYSRRCPVPTAWAAEYGQALEEESKRHESAEKKAEVFQLLSPGGSRGKMRWALERLTRQDVESDEAAAQAHVRDIQPTLEARLVQRTSSGFLRPLPWLRVGDLTGADLVLDEMQAPPDRVARVLAASTVRLPGRLVPPFAGQFDAALDELEAQGLPGWQSHHLLKGQLMLTVDEDLRGQLLGRTFRYDRDVGLRVEVDEHRIPGKPQRKGITDG